MVTFTTANDGNPLYPKLWYTTHNVVSSDNPVSIPVAVNQNENGSDLRNLTPFNGKLYFTYRMVS